jgi:RecB family endonuclease NucS
MGDESMAVIKRLEDIKIEDVQNLTKRDFLDMRIDRWNNDNARNKNKEALFCDYIENNLADILEHLYKNNEVVAYAREYQMHIGRFDFIVKLDNGRYCIIEVKHSNEKLNNSLTFSYALGQLMTYAGLLKIQYDIDKENIDLLLITDEEELLPLGIINMYDLPIMYMVVGKDMVKCYA